MTLLKTIWLRTLKLFTHIKNIIISNQKEHTVKTDSVVDLDKTEENSDDIETIEKFTSEATDNLRKQVGLIWQKFYIIHI